MVNIDFDEDAFVENLNNWNQLNLQNYSYEYSDFGYSYSGTASDIEIANEEVNSIVALSENEIQDGDQYLIDDLFAEIQSIYEENEGAELTSNGYLKEINVVYDEDYYFPKEVHYIYHIPEDIEGLWNRYQYIKAFEVQD